MTMLRHRRSRLALALPLALPLALVLPLSACGGGSGASSGATQSGTAGATTKPTGQITVYNAQHETLTQAWVQGFEKATGVKVNLRNGDDTEMSNQLIAEGNASPADVFLTENSPAMSMVAKKGLFAPVEAATLAKVTNQFKPSDGLWVGIAARSTVFAYNKTKLNSATLPTSIMDLAKPQWKGKWGASPSGADFQTIVSAMLQLKGKDATLSWLKAMSTNAKIYQGNGAVMKAVNAGEIAGGVIYHYYWFGDQAKTGENSKNVSLEYFGHQDPGAFVSVSGGGVLKSSKNPVAAQAFLAYILSQQGQDVLKNGTSFEYAVATGAQSNPKLTPLAKLDSPTVDPATLNSPEVVQLMQEAGLL